MWRLSPKDWGKPAGRTAGAAGSWTPTSTRVHEQRAVAMNASDHPAELQRGRRGLGTSAPPARLPHRLLRLPRIEGPPAQRANGIVLSTPARAPAFLEWSTRELS